MSAPLLIVDIGAASGGPLYDRAAAIAAGLRSSTVIYCPVPTPAADTDECTARAAARAGAFEHAGLEAQARVEAVDAPAQSALSQIEAVQPAMAIVCSSGLNRRYALHCQTLIQSLLERASCDLWIVQRELDDRRKVVLATIDLDVKDTATRMRGVVLSQARRYAQTFGKEAHVVHSFSTSATQDMVIDVLPTRRAGKHHKELEKEHVERVHEFAGRHGYHPEYVHIDAGDLVDTLRRLVDPMGVDTVVVGTSLRSGISHLLTGSHVAALLDSLPCDVWVVRP